MHIIEVVFPTPPAGTKPIVAEPVTRGASFEDITWDFVSCNSNVKWVEIEFTDANDTFFAQGGANPTKYAKLLHPQGQKVQIWGQVPEYQNAPSPVQAKYTITGYDGNPNAATTQVVAQLDPLFVTDKP